MRRSVAGSLVVAASLVGWGVVPAPVADAVVGAGRSVCYILDEGLIAHPGSLVVDNITPVDATTPGFGVLVSADAVVPGPASSVNFGPGSFDPNIAAAVGPSVCFRDSVHGDVDVVVDRQFELLPGTFQASPSPTRLVDTRIGVGGGTLAAGERRCFAASGEVGSAAFVNLTPVDAGAAGFGSLSSSDAVDRPATSNVNFGPGTVDPNVAAATVGADGRVCFWNSVHTGVDLIADQMFTVLPASLSVAPGAGTRLVDTRVGLGGTRIGPGERRCIAGVGTRGDTVVVNLTPVGASAPGHGQLVSSDGPIPVDRSNVNYGPSSFDPNLAAARVGADGSVCFVNSDLASIDLVVDHLLTISVAAVGSGPWVRFDTRDVSPTASEQVCPSPDTCLAIVDRAVVRTVDGGTTWYHQWFGGLGNDPSLTCDADLCLVRNPGTVSTPYSGFLDRSLWVSSDAGVSWTTVSPDLHSFACPIDGTCLAVGERRGPYGTSFTPVASVSRDSAHTWSDVSTPVEPWSCGDPCTGPAPTALIGELTCPTTVRCTAPTWTGDRLEFTTVDGWTTSVTVIVP